MSPHKRSSDDMPVGYTGLTALWRQECDIKSRNHCYAQQHIHVSAALEELLESLYTEIQQLLETVFSTVLLMNT
jgi:hypothetical protein